MISAWKPRRSAQRRYMRSSISAQSWLSVPPAPGWIVRKALRAVVLAGEQGADLLGVDLRGEGPSGPRLISGMASRSPSAQQLEEHRQLLQAVVDRRARTPVRRAGRCAPCETAVAAAASFQNAGFAISASRASSRFCCAARSKMPPEGLGPLAHCLEALAQLSLGFHLLLVSPSGKICDMIHDPRPGGKWRGSPPGTAGAPAGFALPPAGCYFEAVRAGRASRHGG